MRLVIGKLPLYFFQLCEILLVSTILSLLALLNLRDDLVRRSFCSVYVVGKRVQSLACDRSGQAVVVRADLEGAHCAGDDIRICGGLRDLVDGFVSVEARCLPRSILSCHHKEIS